MKKLLFALIVLSVLVFPCIVDETTITLGKEGVGIADIEDFEEAGFDVIIYPEYNQIKIKGSYERSERSTAVTGILPMLVERGLITGLEQEDIDTILDLSGQYDVIGYYEEWEGYNLRCGPVASTTSESNTFGTGIPPKSDSELEVDGAPLGGAVDEEIVETEEITIEKIISAVVIFAIVASITFAGYQITMQVHVPVGVVELIDNSTRKQILEELGESEKIPSYFSNKLNKSKSTIFEHLEKMRNAGLVEKIEQHGKKFVYYKITRIGKHLLRRGS